MGWAFRWTLNQPPDVDWSILDELEQRPIIEEFDEPIKLEEVTTAIKNIRLKRSPGPDGILPEVHVYGGRTPISFLLAIFNLFWISAKLRSDLINAIICILFKKVDRSDGGNYRGISLLSVVGKIFADIVLRGVKRLAELVYPLSVRLQRRQRHNWWHVHLVSNDGNMQRTAPKLAHRLYWLHQSLLIA